jgi:hypothetical protein
MKSNCSGAIGLVYDRKYEVFLKPNDLHCKLLPHCHFSSLRRQRRRRFNPLATDIENRVCSCFLKIAALFAKLQHLRA